MDVPGGVVVCGICAYTCAPILLIRGLVRPRLPQLRFLVRLHG